MKRMVILSCLMMLAGQVSADPVTLRIGLDEAEKAAIEQSGALQTAKQAAVAATAKAQAQKALLWPRLSLEGNIRYITEVPEIEINLPVPHAEPMQIQMGDHLNYSVGLQLGWQIWDGLAIRAAGHALEQIAEAKQLECKAVEQDVILQTRLAYFRTQLALEQVQAIMDALRLAQAQHRDIRLQAQAGASSRIDDISSRMDVSERCKQLREARAALSGALLDLLRQMGRPIDSDLSLPLAGDLKEKLPPDVAPPTVWLSLDSMETVRQRFTTAAGTFNLAEHPRAQSIMANGTAAQSMARSMAAGYWPQIYGYAKSSLDYPNQVVLDTVQQNTVGASLSWTLWQAGRTGEMVREQDAQVQSAKDKHEQVVMDLNLVRDKAMDQLSQLDDIQKLNHRQEQDSEELATLVYDAYRAGRLKYLDVQSANLRVLQIKTQIAVTETQRLIQLALLESLHSGGTNP